MAEAEKIIKENEREVRYIFVGVESCAWLAPGYSGFDIDWP